MLQNNQLSIGTVVIHVLLFSLDNIKKVNHVYNVSHEESKTNSSKIYRNGFLFNEPSYCQ